MVGRVCRPQGVSGYTRLQGDIAPPHLQGFPATVGQRAKGIPLITNLLAPGVDIVGVIVIQLTVGTAKGGETWQGHNGWTRMHLPPKVLVPGYVKVEGY